MASVSHTHNETSHTCEISPVALIAVNVCGLTEKEPCKATPWLNILYMDAEKFDLILKYLSDHEDINVNEHRLKRDVFPELHKDQIVFLIDEMENIKPEVFFRYNKGYTNPIKANGITKPFLENGGFTKIKLDKEKSEKKIIYKEDLELKKLKADFEATKLKLKDYQTTKTLSWIGGFIGIVLAILKLIEWLG